MIHVTEVWQDEASVQAALTAEPEPDAPSPADVLALLASPPRRTDLTVLGEWAWARRDGGPGKRSVTPS